jgi:hypothetical protein
MRRLLLLVLLIATWSFTAAQDRPEPSPALVAQLDSLEEDAMEIRGLALDGDVERIFPPREDVAAFITGQLDEDEVRAYYEEAALVYKSFDLLDPDVDLVAVLQALLEAQIGGYYDPETKQMNTLLITGGELADRLPLLEQIVYVHEFTHALQDANFDLFTLMGGENDVAFNTQYPDASLARLSLIEGDATEVMTQYAVVAATERPAEVLAELAALTDLISTLEIPPGTPKILEQELTFPYVQGQVFVQALLEEGGWELVNQAFASPPVSSEQVINPAKYLEGDLPHEVGVADVSAAMDNGWVELYHRTAGEFFLRRYLETQLSAFDVVRAAGGWGGDAYRFYVNEEMQQTAWVWALSWDTQEDATQFNNAALNFLNARYPASSGGFGLCWEGELDAMCYGQAGEDIILVKAPTLDLATAMRDTATGE